MAGVHPIHRSDAPYGQPEVHMPFPESGGYPSYHQDDDPDRESLTGETKGDESPEDWVIPNEIFEEEVLDGIGIGKNSVLMSNWSPADRRSEWLSLIPIPRSQAEEKGKSFPQAGTLPHRQINPALHEVVMASLRKRVAELEEEELFESSMKNFTHRASTATDPTSGIITVSGNYLGGVGEPNAAGLGDQPRPVDEEGERRDGVFLLKDVCFTTLRNKDTVVAGGPYVEIKDKCFRIGHVGPTVVADAQRGTIDTLAQRHTASEEREI
ncbi:hypothetical protein BU17DRAFT_100376 [Hysterangium stoloniferum]|nr:hypothetical protein BU17DRAFT_100376 [Hysterangium stoloniferum]